MSDAPSGSVLIVIDASAGGGGGGWSVPPVALKPGDTITITIGEGGCGGSSGLPSHQQKQVKR